MDHCDFVCFSFLAKSSSSFLILVETSSNKFPSISIKDFMTLRVMLWTVWFQWDFEFFRSPLSIIPNIIFLFSVIILTTCSLLIKNRILSATWKWLLVTHKENRLKRSSWITVSFWLWASSKISSSSVRNNTSFAAFVIGHILSKYAQILLANVMSFSRYWPVQQRLEVVALPRVFWVEQLEQLQNERVGEGFSDFARVHFVVHDESEEQFVDHLVVGPCFFQIWLIFIRIKSWSFLLGRPSSQSSK